MLDTVKEGLKEIDKNVQYGICKKEDTWDCLLIKKDRIAKSGKSNLDTSVYITISIIREDEIPDGLEFKVEEKMREMGYRRTSADAKYDYTVDSNEVVIEICTLEFVKASKWI